MSLGTNSLIHGVKSIREANMRSAVLAEKLDNSCISDAFNALEELVARGGRGDLGVSLALAALIASLEPPSRVAYQTRADLYALASEKGAAEITYILLEGDLAIGNEVADTPRAIVPNGPVLTLGARKTAARSPDRTLLSHLIHDPNVQVITILLGNPHLVESDLLVMASKRPADPAALRLISVHPRWSKPRSVRYALTLNPDCPIPLACRLCLDLRDSDLREITGNASSPPLLRGHADRLLQKRRSRH